jgi:hypothetical protein
MANVRYQLKEDVYMKIDGLWALVAAGTVFDDKGTVNYASRHVTVLNETIPGLASHGTATPVRSVRIK